MVGEAKAKNGVKQQKEKKNQAVDWEGRKGGALSPPQTPAQFASPADFFFAFFPHSRACSQAGTQVDGRISSK